MDEGTTPGRIILFGNEKGGTGKTTLATTFAVLAAERGMDTLLVDADVQTSAKTWYDARRELHPELPDFACTVGRGRIAVDLRGFARKYALVVVDAGGRDSVELRQAMAVCTTMVVPIRPSQFDAWALDKVHVMLQQLDEQLDLRLDARLLLNATSPNPLSREAAEVREALADIYAERMPLMACSVPERAAYRRAARDGLSVADPVAGSLPGRTDMLAMFKEVLDGQAAQD